VHLHSAATEDSVALGRLKPTCQETVVGFRGISNSLPAFAFWRLGKFARLWRKSMNSELKTLVEALERVLSERGGSLDAPAREAFYEQIEKLKRRIDEAGETDFVELSAAALNVLAALLSVVTNVMTFWK
jgi:hypothetical protein